MWSLWDFCVWFLCVSNMAYDSGRGCRRLQNLCNYERYLCMLRGVLLAQTIFRGACMCIVYPGWETAGGAGDVRLVGCIDASWPKIVIGWPKLELNWLVQYAEKAVGCMQTYPREYLRLLERQSPQFSLLYWKNNNVNNSITYPLGSRCGTFSYKFWSKLENFDWG